MSSVCLQTSNANVTGGCDICGHLSARELYTAEDRLSNAGWSFFIARCEGCGVLRTLPEMTEDELASFYPRDYWGAGQEFSERWLRKSQGEKLKFLDAHSLDGGRILDTGCGSGLFLRSLDSRRWDRCGVETGERAWEAATKSLGADNIFHGTLLDARFDAASFDTVSFWSALEHMNNPRENLLEAARVLRRGGTLIVQVPNAGCYQARFFGGDWFALDAPRHRYHFSRQTLDCLLDQAGFEPYGATMFSRAHNAHALRQSLKKRLEAGRGGISYIGFCLTIPFIKPADFILTLLGSGATLTVAARKR